MDGNGKRNIGAIQLSLAPHLAVARVSGGSVESQWTRPKDPDSGAVKGYIVYYRHVNSGYYKAVTVFGPDTLTALITGLTNGTGYEFYVVGVKEGGNPGPESNLVKATPRAVNRTPDRHETLGPKANNPRYLENLGYGSCTKYDDLDDDFGSVWILDARVRALILKSGTANDVWEYPADGMHGTASGKDISHGPGPAPAHSN